MTPAYRGNLGRWGENVAKAFLVKHGYSPIQQNFLKKSGEIDIICRKKGKIHFIEVKTVSQKTVSRETDDQYDGMQKISPQKISRIKRAIQLYFLEQREELEWEFHAIIVTVSHLRKSINLRFVKNLII